MSPADFTKGNLTDAADRHRWVLEHVKYVEDNFLDGLNVDYEQAISKDQPKLRDALTALIRELSDALRRRYKNPQVKGWLSNTPAHDAVLMFIMTLFGWNITSMG